MLQWLQLAVWLLLSAAVNGRNVQCGDVVHGNYCWNSQTLVVYQCWSCAIRNQQITSNEVTMTISLKHANGSDVDIEFVAFIAGDVTKMPKVIQRNNSEVLRVLLLETNTRVLNSQFFGNVTQNIQYFRCYQNFNLSVEASAFRNCAVLEVLHLSNNKISSISPDGFLGLQNLIRLDLNNNELTVINENWFVELDNLEKLDLGSNQLKEIPDAAFNKLYKLKKLYLHNNQIEIVRRRMFQDNQQLQRIYLHDNQIKVIQSGTFGHLSKLSVLDLRGIFCINTYFNNETSERISAALTTCLPTICVIPVIQNGFIINTKNNATETPGESLDTFASATVVCNENFTLFYKKETQTANVCLKNDWSQQWPQCHRKYLML